MGNVSYARSFVETALFNICRDAPKIVVAAIYGASAVTAAYFLG